MNNNTENEFIDHEETTPEPPVEKVLFTKYPVLSVLVILLAAIFVAIMLLLSGDK